MSREDYIQEIIESSSRLKRLALTDRSKLGDLNLSRAQLELIHLLFFHEQLGVKEAASLIGVSTSAVSQLADSLAAEFYVSREAGPEDRRQIRLSLTSRGKNVIKTLRKNLSSGFRATLDTLDDKEIETLSKIYKKMVDNSSKLEGK
jgi:DNA-binding MarR family transcriptional regulator